MRYGKDVDDSSMKSHNVHDEKSGSRNTDGGGRSSVDSTTYCDDNSHSNYSISEISSCIRRQWTRDVHDPTHSCSSSTIEGFGYSLGSRMSSGGFQDSVLNTRV